MKLAAWVIVGTDLEDVSGKPALAARTDRCQQLPNVAARLFR